MTVFHLIFCFKLTHQLQTRFFFLTSHYFNPIFLCLSVELRWLTFLTFSFILSYFSFSLIIALNSSWLISMSINAWDTNVSMISSLLLANIRISSCFFFFFLVMLSNFLIIPVVRENIKVKLALAIPTDAPTILADEMIQTPLLVALKTIKILSM